MNPLTEKTTANLRVLADVKTEMTKVRQEMAVFKNDTVAAMRNYALESDTKNSIKSLDMRISNEMSALTTKVNSSVSN